MKYRYYTEDDYSTLAQWWEAWGWPVVPKAALPKTAIIISKEGVDLCACFLYKSDSCICWAEYFISNKSAPKDLRKGSIEFLLERIAIEAREQGFTIMISSVKHRGLIKKLIASGYNPEYEKGMSNLMRVL